MAVEHAETIVQLALTGLLSAPVIQTVFQPHENAQQPKSDIELEHHEHKPEQTSSESSPHHQQKATTMTDLAAAAPVVLAPPLPTNVDQERQLFVQNALHSGHFETSTNEERIEIERPTEIQEPQTAGLEDTKESPFNAQPTTTEKEQDPEQKMGLLSVLTGNIPADISSPANRDSSNGHGIISNDLQANTVGPTTKQGIVRSDTVKSHLTTGTRDGVERSATPVGERSATPAFGERASTPIGERASTPIGERAVTPAPISATSERGPTPGATGDGYSPLPVAAQHTTGDVPQHHASAPSLEDGRVGTEALNDRADLPVRERAEEGVPVSGGPDGRYEGVRGEESLARPPLGDDKPSRSYIKRPDSVIGTNTTTSTHNGSIRNGSPSPMQQAPRSVDYATATPAALGHPEKEVVSVPAGGALHHEHEYKEERGETPVRQLTGEQPYGQQQQFNQQQYNQQQQHQYGQYAAPAAGAGLAGAAAYGLHQHHEQQQQQQYPQQGYQNDPSFAHERAMSPGPNNFVAGQQGQHDPSQHMSRLSFQDPPHQQQGGMNGALAPVAAGAGVGPSPGPPVGAFAPTAAQRRTPEPTSDLARNSTMRSTATGGGLSRGSTLRKGGAFANGSALQGAGVGEAFGRDDIHTRTSLGDRQLMGAGTAGAAGMHKISKEEARDAKRLSKMIKVEGKTEAAAVKGAIKELEALQKVQRAAHAEELKAQQKHAKFTRVEHKARLRFLKEKERYERVEAQLRSIEADYEAKREHAAQQTDLLAEKTQELNDLRAQKAADDRERELKLLALKNPGHA